ncbi:MAG: hypothetical protein AB2L18_01990 [Anaerolineaceae bacterium]
MFIWFALIMYAIAPTAVFFLIQQKKEEGLIWLVFLICCSIASILIFLNQTIHAQSDAPYLWLSLNSMILSIAQQWEMPGWVLQQCITFFILIFMMKSYMTREQHTLKLSEIIFLFSTTLLGILVLSLSREFAMAAFLFWLDGLRLLFRVIQNKEIFSNRRDTISLLLRFISIILLILLASLVDTESNVQYTLSPFLLTFGVILLRLGAEFIDQVSPETLSWNWKNWLVFLESIIILRAMSMLPVNINNVEGISFYLLLICGILLLFFFYLWFKRSDHKNNRFIMSVFTYFLAIFFYLLGIREELLFLVLPDYFLLLNDQVQNGKKGTEKILLVSEEIFLLGFAFSPVSGVNKTLLNLQSTTPLVYSAFLLEGLYLAGFALTQKRTNIQALSENKKRFNQNNLLLWFTLAGFILIIIKGFFPIIEFKPSTWVAFSPLLFLVFIPLESIVNRHRASEKTQNEATFYTRSSLIIEKITRIFLFIGNVLQQIFEGVSIVLEREGGLVWAIIFLVLLLTLFKGFSQP